MTQSPKKPSPPLKRDQQRQGNNHNDNGQQTSEDIVIKMVNKIENFTGGLKEYKTRELVEDAEELGTRLAKDLKTTQIRKFLDAVNRLKAKLGGSKELTEEIQSELHLLRPKLAYAAARQQRDREPGPVEPLKRVLEAAIKQIKHLDDFTRLVQLIESIIAYHKAAGGKNQ